MQAHMRGAACMRQVIGACTHWWLGMHACSRTRLAGAGGQHECCGAGSDPAVSTHACMQCCPTQFLPQHATACLLSTMFFCTFIALHTIPSSRRSYIKSCLGGPTPADYETLLAEKEAVKAELDEARRVIAVLQAKVCS